MAALTFCLLLLACLFVPARAGLQLDKAPEEHLYTKSDIVQHNRNDSDATCLCVLDRDNIVFRERIDGVANKAEHKLHKFGRCLQICTKVKSMSEEATSSEHGDNMEIAGRIVKLRLGNLWPLFVWDHKGPRNSNHFADPFTLTHISHGILFFAVWVFFGLAWQRLFIPTENEPTKTMPRYWWTIGGILGAMLEAVWEVSENLPSMIIKFRAGGMSRDYYGDAVINALGDWVAALLGYYACVFVSDYCGISLKAVVFQSLSIFIAMELSLLLYQRDCLLLILMQLFCNPQWLIDFQQQESFADRWLFKGI